MQNAAKRPQIDADQNAAKRHQINAGRSKTTPNLCRTQQNDPKSMQDAAKLFQIDAERVYSLENEVIL